MKADIPNEWMGCRSRDDAVILDTETTGLTDDSEIVDIAIINMSGDVLLDTWVMPKGPIPRDASDSHGITLEKLRKAGALPWPAHHNTVQSLLDEASEIVIYNAEFDTRILDQTARIHGLELQLPKHKVRCAMLDYAQFRGEVGRYGGFRWHKLIDAFERETGMRAFEGHVARADCSMVLALMAAVSIKTQPEHSFDESNDSLSGSSDRQLLAGALSVGAILLAAWIGC